MQNGSLCPECRSRDGENGLTSEEIRKCLLSHNDLNNKLLFRAGGLKTTLRFPDATPQDLFLSDEDRKNRISELNVPTFGSERVIEASEIGFNYVPPLPFTVKEFQPQEGDELTKTWVDAQGNFKSIDLPHFAIADVHQHADHFVNYLKSNYMNWAEHPKSEEPYNTIVALIRSDKTSSSHKELYKELLHFVFAALHKTSTACVAGDPEIPNYPVIQEEGHRLDGKKIMPRMILAQIDPLNTLSILIPAQKALVSQLVSLLETSDPHNWGPCIMSVAALCTLGAIMFADRKRHGQENNLKGRFSVPEFVAEASGAFMVLVAKFHDSEQRCGREAGLQYCDSLVKDYFYQISNLKKVRSDEVETPEWWLGQLVSDPERWVPLATPSESDMKGEE